MIGRAKSDADSSERPAAPVSPSEYARMNKLRQSLGLAVNAVSVKKYGVSDPANAGGSAGAPSAYDHRGSL